jgi:hypothetical protein
MPNLARFKGSRYYGSVIEYTSLKEGTSAYPVIWFDFPSGGEYTFYVHVATEGERLDQIANAYYQRPSMWWKILEINPHITDILNIEPGTVVRIPVE